MFGLKLTILLFYYYYFCSLSYSFFGFFYCLSLDNTNIFFLDFVLI